MRVCELIRTVAVGDMSIRLSIEADGFPCDQCQEHADEVALLVSTLADEDDDPMILAEKIDTMFATVSQVTVIDGQGNGGTVRLASRRE